MIKKKIIRTIALLVCMLTIISAPTYAYAYTLPVCTIHLPNYVRYEYQSPHQIPFPSQELLFNYADNYGGNFLVPANRIPVFIVDCVTSDLYMVEVIMREPAYTTVYIEYVSSAATAFTVPAVAYDRQLILRITPTRGVPVYVNYYTYLYQ